MEEKVTNVFIHIVYWIVMGISFPFKIIGWTAGLVWHGMAYGFYLFREMFITTDEDENDKD